MREMEARYPCPVCLGVTMEKARVGTDGGLLLDHCRRCGGVWFEAGELLLLRQRGAALFWRAIAPRSDAFRMQCHSCQSFIDRNDTKCATCGWMNRLDCPLCQQPMQRGTHQGLTLDSCTSCKGVWFDHHELSSIWSLHLDRSLRRHDPPLHRMADGSGALLEVLAFNPWLAYGAADAAGQLLAGGASMLSHAPEGAAVVVEAAGEAASGVFETIVEIINGLFS